MTEDGLSCAEAHEEFEKYSGQKESSADQRCSPIIGLEPYLKSALLRIQSE
jgi:hypothetical protein